MPTQFFKTRFLIAVFCSLILLTFGCKKAVESQTVDILQQYFDQNVLNRDFIVDSASDNSVGITHQYNDYVFRLEKNTTTNSNTDGPMTAKINGILVCSGTWSCTEQYGKLGINLTTPSIASFSFINRDWKFTSKEWPIMKLAPWVASSRILWMQRL
ncbi:MAG: hypothetical protein ABIT58_05140 [Ferruginibacter sp.]